MDIAGAGWLLSGWRGLSVLALSASVSTGNPSIAPLRPETTSGWNRYVRAVEERRNREWESRTRGPFFVMDTLATGADERRRLLRGELVVADSTADDARGESIDVPSALVHHWRGAVFIPDVTVETLLDELQTTPPSGPEILKSAVLSRGPSFMKVYLRLERTKVVTVVYDTEHDVRFMRASPSQAASTSIATRIVEIDNPGTKAERERAFDDDRGFLWRLNAYWRYEEVDGGVIAECESLSLSRDVPLGLGTILRPVIRGTARESMERTLVALRESLSIRPATLLARTGSGG